MVWWGNALLGAHVSQAIRLVHGCDLRPDRTCVRPHSLYGAISFGTPVERDFEIG